MRTVILLLTSVLAASASEVSARDRDDNRNSRAMYSEQGRSATAGRDQRDDRRHDGARDQRRDQDRDQHQDRRDWRDSDRDLADRRSDRRSDQHSEHQHRDRDWDRDHDRYDRRDWRDRNHRHYRDYDRYDSHYYYYSPAPRRVIYFNDGRGHYRHYNLRHDFHSHFYDPFYFHGGVHIHAGCHYHHFGDAIAAGIVIGAILGDW